MDEKPCSIELTAFNLGVAGKLNISKKEDFWSESV